MKNRDISYAQEYHQETKHTEMSLRTSAHYLDWENKPFPFKIYEGPPSVPLPRDFPRPESDALACISGLGRGKETDFGISQLAELLFFSAGLTRKFRFGGETLYMRAASATGALYPIELYVVCGDFPGLKAGVYHFNPFDFALVQIRAGDFRVELAAVSDEKVRSAPATIVFSSLAWRNAWKYEARSYRHWFWDGGVIAANLLAVLASTGISTRIVASFVDASVNELLGLAHGKEATVFLMPLGIGLEGAENRPPRPVARVDGKFRPLSREEVDYPEIWRMHEASSLSSPDDVKSWVREKIPLAERAPAGPTFPLSERESSPREKLGDVILRRGSSRRFSQNPVGFSELSTIVRTSTEQLPLDYSRDGNGLIDVYFLANAVEGLPVGSYFFNRKMDIFDQLKSGKMRWASSYLCLEQPLFGDASVVFFLMSPLGEVLKVFGNRGYRTAQLEGGIVAGRIYLSAYALGLGASGSTFYDDAVTEFFSPHAKDMSAMIAVGVGVPGYKARPGKVLAQFS